jgi:hypothetical protein
MHVVTRPFVTFPNCDRAASEQAWPWKEEFKLDTAAVGSNLRNEEFRPVRPANAALLCEGETLALLQQATLATAACPVAKMVAIVLDSSATASAMRWEQPDTASDPNADQSEFELPLGNTTKHKYCDDIITASRQQCKYRNK